MPEQDWQQRLRATGHRLTRQRELVLQAVEELGHGTPDEVYGAVKDSGINLSTVYRTLELLNDLGLIRHTHLSDRAPTYHSTTGEEHVHLVCRGCGQVSSVARDELAPFVDGLRDRRGFRVDVGHLTVFGWCRACAADVTDAGL